MGRRKSWSITATEGKSDREIILAAMEIAVGDIRALARCRKLLHDLDAKARAEKIPPGANVAVSNGLIPSPRHWRFRE